MNRRKFLRNSVGAAGLAALGARGYAMDPGPALRVGVIGSGWYGKTDLLHLMQVAPVEVVGLCDVDRRMLEAAADLVATRQPSGKRPPLYLDYRRLLADQEPEIVIIGTPDHWHCLPAVDACRAGADVYVQKPVSYDVVEGQAMVAAARKYGRTVQVGLERRGTPHLLEARERFIDSGRMGRIGHVDVYSYTGGSDFVFPPESPPPDYLDWERYVGPADWRAHNPGIHPRRWRNCRAFSNGQTGDLCVHFLDLVRDFLGLGWPRMIAATGGSRMRPPDSGVDVHDTQSALFDFDDVQVVWNQKNWGLSPVDAFPWGAILYGERGTLKLNVRYYEFIPVDGGASIRGDYVDERDQFPGDVAHAPTEIFAAPGNRRMLLDFVQCRQSGRRPLADIEEGHISSACCILANLSMDLGRSLRWDAAHERVLNDDEANRRLARPYRGDWVHPTPEDV